MLDVGTNISREWLSFISFIVCNILRAEFDRWMMLVEIIFRKIVSCGFIFVKNL